MIMMVIFMFADAVFEGGGVKGIGIVGAVCCLEEMGYHWKRLAGTSAGAIIAALLASGYSGLEIKNILLKIDYKKLLDKSRIQSIPALGKPLGFIFEKSIYNGKAFEDWIEGLLKEKKITKFRDVYINGEYRLKIIASDITKKQMLILPDDLVKYWIDPMNFSISRAVRMSIGIPFYFKPVCLKGKEGDSIIVDGGILSNYPVWIFDVIGAPRWPTIGFKLVEPDLQFKESLKTGIISYTLDIVRTMLEEDDARYIKNENFIRTISIPTMGIKTTEFDISISRRIQLFNSGFASARSFLDVWNFNKYIDKFRSSTYPSRRKMLML